MAESRLGRRTRSLDTFHSLDAGITVGIDGPRATQLQVTPLRAMGTESIVHDDHLSLLRIALHCRGTPMFALRTVAALQVRTVRSPIWKQMRGLKGLRHGRMCPAPPGDTARPNANAFGIGSAVRITMDAP